MPERTVRGVRQRFAASAAGYHALRLGGGRIPRIAQGWMPWLGLDPFAVPALPARDWVRVRPILAGVCGSDMALLTGKVSPTLSPFGSFPAVMGHEVVGTVTEVGPEADANWVGKRVVLDPLLGCEPRGLEPCRWCVAGQPGLCLRLAEGDVSPAPMLGFCHDVPGGWSEEMVAHVSQLHAVPEPLSDEAAVMVEPLSVAMHGVLARRPAAGERVLVVGAGSIGQCTVASLTMLAPEADVAVVARYPAQREMALWLGAKAIYADALEAAVERAGATRHATIVGDDVLTGGFDHVYDCVGSAGSLSAAFRAARAGGRVTLLGGPGILHDVDWTLVWTRELHIAGSYVYGREDGLPGSPHTMDEAMRLLLEHADLPVGELVTHRYPLAEWRRAMQAALRRGPSAALKVVFASDRSIQP